MPPWLLLWIARFAAGERWRKATSADYRLGFGGLFLGGVFMIVGVKLGKRFLGQASAVTLWFCFTAAVSVLIFGTIAWSRRVPAAVSLALSVISWGVFVWMALGDHL